MNSTAGISILVLMVLTCIFMAAADRDAAASTLMQCGTLFLDNGTIIKVEAFVKVLVPDEIIYGESGGKEEEVRISSVSKIRLLTEGVDYVFDNSKFTKKSGTMEITLKNGGKTVLENAYFPEKNFTIKIRNSKTGQLEDQEISFKSVKEIFLGKGPIVYKRCPSDRRVFPSDYLYCPYDKTLLEKVVEKKN